jgi:hypothetical protein
VDAFLFQQAQTKHSQPWLGFSQTLQQRNVRDRSQTGRLGPYDRFAQGIAERYVKQKCTHQSVDAGEATESLDGSKPAGLLLPIVGEETKQHLLAFI